MFKNNIPFIIIFSLIIIKVLEGKLNFGFGASATANSQHETRQCEGLNGCQENIIKARLQQQADQISQNEDPITRTIHNFDFTNLKYTTFDKIDDAKALYRLHDDVDDDDDGAISFSESQFFFEANNKQQDTQNIISSFESDSDGEITFTELWNYWITSTVHNWTSEELINWLEHECEMTEYSDSFRVRNFSGAILPRLALSDFSFLKQIGVRSFIHRRRIMLKAMDAVLYGPPKARHSFYKDIMLYIAVIFTICSITYALIIRKKIKLANR